MRATDAGSADHFHRIWQAESPGSFKYFEDWTYNGSFVGSVGRTINVPMHDTGATTTYVRTINVSANGQGTGTGFFDVVPVVVEGV